MTIIIISPSTDVTELTSETFQAEGYDIDMDECWKIYKMLGIQIFPSELYSISAFKPYFKDKIFFDIGASVGSWSAFALMYGAKEVYAFDPLPDDRVSPTDNYNRLVTKVNNTATTLDWFSNCSNFHPHEQFFCRSGVVEIAAFRGILKAVDTRL